MYITKGLPTRAVLLGRSPLKINIFVILCRSVISTLIHKSSSREPEWKADVEKKRKIHSSPAPNAPRLFRGGTGIAPVGFLCDRHRRGSKRE